MVKFLLALIFFMGACHALDIKEIPPQDRQKLEQFFEYIMTRTTLGYTLCGEKPCSIETYPILTKLPVRHSVKIFFKYQGYSILIKGWEVWSKYSNYFPSKNFVFRRVSDSNTFILINKRATKTVIRKNLDLFKKYTNDQTVSVDIILDNICNPSNKDKDYLIKYQITLLGILLGYGRNNSIAFNQKSYVQNLKKFELDNSYQSFNLILNPGFLAIQNGTNEEENRSVKKCLLQAKQNIKKHSNRNTYFESFIKFYQN